RMGYRWYQAEGIEPLFEFGYGLSYTTFSLTELAFDGGDWTEEGPVTVSGTLSNTGAVAGAEVVQVYVQLPPATGQPPRRLVGFRKVWLEPGESLRVEIPIHLAASHHPMSVWSPAERAFVIPEGEFIMHMGTSSARTNPAGSFRVNP